MLPPLHSEIFRLVRRWMPRVLVLLAVLIVLAIYLLLWTVVRTRAGHARNEGDILNLEHALQLRAVRDTGLGYVQAFGTLMIVILSAAVIGNEFGWGTIRTILPRTRGRSAFLGAKFVVLALFTVLIVVVGYIAALIGSFFYTLMEGANRSFGPDAFVRTVESLGRTVYVALPYLALAVLVAVWSRSTAAGIGVGLGVFFLEPVVLGLIGLAGGFWNRLPGALLNRNVAAVMHLNAIGAGTNPSSEALPNAWQAAGVLAIYTAVFVALAFWLFRKRDISVG